MPARRSKPREQRRLTRRVFPVPSARLRRNTECETDLAAGPATRVLACRSESHRDSCVLRCCHAGGQSHERQHGCPTCKDIIVACTSDMRREEPAFLCYVV